MRLDSRPLHSFIISHYFLSLNRFFCAHVFIQAPIRTPLHSSGLPSRGPIRPLLFSNGGLIGQMFGGAGAQISTQLVGSVVVHVAPRLDYKFANLELGVSETTLVALS